MKTALIGFANNIHLHLDKLKCWSHSFQKFNPGSDVYLICANSTENEIEHCKQLGIIPIAVNVLQEDLGFINHKRLSHTYDFIKTCDHDLFIITDAFDVIFQNNPFTRLDTTNYDIFLGAEGINLGGEPWNFDTIKKNFPEYLDGCVLTPVVCSGVIAGKREALISLYTRMYELCENSQKGHNIIDQAALIVMLSLNEIPKVKLFQLNEHWTVHCAVAGPTNLFELWGFKNRILEQGFDIPYLEENQIKASGVLYDIVHQFNRIPEWNKALTSVYLNNE
jgi:hypothetical protein